MTTPDVASLFSGSPSGPSQNVKFRQGLIKTFNQLTLENTIDVGGVTLTNLPILGVGEATLLVPGAVVGILVVGEENQAKTMMIMGRSVIPNTTDAANAVSLLNSQIFSDFIITGETCTSATYVDLATVGPRVTVPVGPSGRILIIASAQIQAFTGVAGANTTDGRFDVDFTGANTRAPSEASDPLVGIANMTVNLGGGITDAIGMADSTTTQAIFSGLTPGNTIIKMMYRRTGATIDPQFSRRGLTVIKM